MSDHYRIILKRLLARTYVRTYPFPFLLQFFEYIYIYIQGKNERNKIRGTMVRVRRDYKERADVIGR